VFGGLARMGIPMSILGLSIRIRIRIHFNQV
jgi:hypothetical protein